MCAAGASTYPPGFTEGVLAGGLTNPTAMAFAPDGRLFVSEQGGRLRVIKDGLLLPAPFVTLTVNAVGERGLLGVAFDPAFATNHWVYVYYTATTPDIHNRVSRFTAGGDVALAGSELVLLDLNVEPVTSSANHNGGALQFGRDGKLYISVGDNGDVSNSQSLLTRFGKILRVNADGSIPPDNPFFDTATGVHRAIWALGLRNPFTIAVQPGTGRLFVNDVGQNAWEEINDGMAGANYGWPTCEGPNRIFTEVPCDAGFDGPFHAYDRRTTAECAIIGGAFYNPQTVQYPAAFVNAYFFADLCAGWIRRIDPATGVVSDFGAGISSPVAIGLSGDGSLHYLTRGGSVYRINYSATGNPRPGAPADYNGDGTDDLAVFRPSDGAWRVRNQFTVQWGDPGDVPVPGDYNGDGIDRRGGLPALDRRVVRAQPVRGAVRRARRRAGAGRLQRRRHDRRGGVPPVERSLVRAQRARGSRTGARGTFRFRPTTPAMGRSTRPCIARPPGRGWCSARRRSSWERRATCRCRPTTPATAWPISRSTGHRPGRGSSRTSRRCRTAAPATSPSRATSTATASPTSRSIGPPPAQWFVRGQFIVRFGDPGDVPIPRGPSPARAIAGDYDGDGRANIAVYRPSDGRWFVRDRLAVQFGDAGDLPVPADYNGDGAIDVAVFRPSTGVWFVRGQFAVRFGDAGDVPVPGDYNGDGAMDVAVYRPSTAQWFVRDQFLLAFGAPGDRPIPGDYNADGVTDIAVYRPSTGQWFVRNLFTVQYGDAGDVPIPGNYNGDARSTSRCIARPPASGSCATSSRSCGSGSRTTCRCPRTTTATASRTSRSIVRRPGSGSSVIS